MSGEGKAVFLSYAREDADAARRIAEALRSHGLEVWFDENELRGGDSWDAKIRRQIDDCTLFVPIISAHTDQRAKGYFRLEWKLAVDQTHLRAEGVPFLAPVVIDETTESGAIVPSEFMRVQWTRVPGALPSTEFVAQIRRLLEAPHRAGGGQTVSSFARTTEDREGGGSGTGDRRQATGGRGRRPKPRVLKWLIPAAAVAAIGLAYFAFRPAARTPASAAPLSAVLSAVGQAKAEGSAKAEAASLTPAAQPPTDFAPAKSVAVLAFADLSAEKDSEYFSDGISEELLNVLAKVPGLKVSARTSAFYFKGKQVPISDIAKQLGVAFVVEGSVRKAGNRVRITAQLISAADGFHVWSDDFDRELKDIFAVQDEIAGLIAQKLQLTLDMSTGVARAVNPEAFSLYLQARQYAETLSRSNMDRAETLFRRALEVDPDFTRAAAGLQMLRLTRAGNRCIAAHYLETELAAIERDTRELLRRDPNLGVVHAVLAIIQFMLGHWDDAQMEFRQADKLGFSREVSSRYVAWVHYQSGRIDLGIAAMKQAHQLNPLDWTMSDVDGLGWLYARHYSEAADAFRTASQQGGAPVTLANLALALNGLGRTEEAIAAARAALNMGDRTDWVPGFLAWSDGVAAWALAAAGAKEEAEVVVRRLLSGPAESRYAAGFALGKLGRLEEASAVLVDMGGPYGYLYFFLNEHPDLMKDPRFARLLPALHLEEGFNTFRRMVAGLAPQI